MDDLFLVLFFISILALFIGLINPNIVVRWGKNKTRGKVLLYYGLCSVLFLIIFGIIAESEYYERGNEYFNKKDYNEAIKYFNKVKEDDENYDLAQALLKTADSLWAIEKYEQSIKDSTTKVKNQRQLDSIAVAEAKIKEKIKIERLKKEVQRNFINKKVSLYKDGYINAKNYAQKGLFFVNTKKITKNFLDSLNYTLTDWEGKISIIMFSYGHTTRDRELLKKMSPEKLIEKYPEGRDINISIIIADEDIGSNASYVAKVHQEHNPNKKLRGIKPNDDLYDKVISLEEGQKIRFSAKVIDVREYKSEIEQATLFTVKLTDIEPIE